MEFMVKTGQILCLFASYCEQVSVKSSLMRKLYPIHKGQIWAFFGNKGGVILEFMVNLGHILSSFENLCH